MNIIGTDMTIFFLDNLERIIATIVLVTIFLFYFITWFRYGRDIRGGTIIPLVGPPEKLSPAAVRYIRRMGYDDKTLAVSIINMAVKGYLTITEKKKTYKLIKREDYKEDDEKKLSVEEELVANKLFRKRSEIIFGKWESIEDDLDTDDNEEALEDEKEEALDENYTEYQRSCKRLSSATDILQEHLEKEYQNRYFISNVKYFIKGLGISFIGFIVMVLIIWLESGKDEAIGTLFLTVIFALTWFGLFGLIFNKCKHATSWLGIPLSGWGFYLALFIIFVIGVPWSFIFFVIADVYLGFAFLAIFALNYLFYHFLKVRTKEGKIILDQIEGFRMYLSTAGKDRLNILNPPELTPELFEKFLPYAIALDVEQQWNLKFADTLKVSSQVSSGEYSPSWYIGSHLNALGTIGKASSIGNSISSAISVSETF